MSIDNGNDSISMYKEAKSSGTGIFVGLALGLILGVIGWIIAYFVHKNYYEKGNYNDAKGVKIGTFISIAIGIISSIFIFFIFLAILVPNFDRAKNQGQLTACKSNLKNIGVACEMYASDHDGSYPTKLSELTTGVMGGYLKFIPTCPVAGEDTYTVSYSFVASKEPAFTVYCSGHNHPEVPENAPLYSSSLGICEDGSGQ